MAGRRIDLNEGAVTLQNFRRQLLPVDGLVASGVLRPQRAKGGNGEREDQHAFHADNVADGALPVLHPAFDVAFSGPRTSSGVDAASPPASVTFDSTDSSTGVMHRSCLARIIRFQSGSNFFQPAA
mgnify:CR=1 FL=1